MSNDGGHADKDNYVDSGNVKDRDQDGREGFGDDGGTRVGKPDPAEHAGPSTGTAGDEGGLEGSILDDESTERGTSTRDTSTRGGQQAQGQQQSRVQQASHGDPHVGSLGGGGEAVQGMHAAGRADGGTDRAGSEPLDRSREHKGSYGGEGGSPRTSSNEREPINPS